MGCWFKTTPYWLISLFWEITQGRLSFYAIFKKLALDPSFFLSPEAFRWEVVSMTNAEKETIIALKIQGLGCNRIAKISGVPLGTVKSFLSRTEIELPKPQEGICLECGAPIAAVPHTKPRRFCSGTCRQKWWNAHLHMVNRKAFYNFTCPWCGKKFTAYGNDHRIYCSRECYADARRKNGKLPEHFNV